MTAFLIFPKALFRNYYSSINLDLSADKTAAEWYLIKYFMFCLQNKNVYEIATNSQRNMKTKISGNKNFQTISYRIYDTFSAYLWFTRNEMDLDYYHQKLNVRITSRVVERRSLLNCMLGRIVDVLACLRVFFIYFI